jgi:hypothetical protein
MLAGALLRADASGYLLAAVPLGAGAALLSLDVARGAVRWNVSGGGGGGPRALAVGAGGAPQRALLATRACVLCVGAAGGDMLWQRCFPAVWAAAAGAWGSLLLTQDAPVASATLSLSLLDEASGAQQWVVTMPPAVLTAAAAAASRVDLFSLSARKALVVINGSRVIQVDGYAGAGNSGAAAAAAAAAADATGAAVGGTIAALLAVALAANIWHTRVRARRLARVAPADAGKGGGGGDVAAAPPPPPLAMPAAAGPDADAEEVRALLEELVAAVERGGGAAAAAANAAGTPQRHPSPTAGHETPQSETMGTPDDAALDALLTSSQSLAARAAALRDGRGGRGASRGSEGGATPRAAPLPTRSRALGAAGSAALLASPAPAALALVEAGGRAAIAALARARAEEAHSRAGTPSRPTSRLAKESPYWAAGGDGNLPYVHPANPHAPFFAPPPAVRQRQGLNLEQVDAAVRAGLAPKRRGRE